MHILCYIYSALLNLSTITTSFTLTQNTESWLCLFTLSIVANCL